MTIPWLALTVDQRRAVINNVEINSGFPAKAIEKDWWVTIVLKALFNTNYSENLLFKGGTSLSKCWHLINRFSEDIDVAIDKEIVGFEGDINPSSIKRLKKLSLAFTTTKLKDALEIEMLSLGVPAGEFSIVPEEAKSSETDPAKLIILYNPIIAPVLYIKDQVELEVTARSLKEPYSTIQISSIIDEYSSGSSFSLSPFQIPTVKPERTFLEKAFLLHEELSKPPEKIKTYRMSRHFYDLHMIMDTDYGSIAINSSDLYQTIVSHRSTFNKIAGIDYNSHLPNTIDFIPQDNLIKPWEEDYIEMRKMMAGEPPTFFVLMERMRELRNRFRQIVITPGSRT